MLEMGVKQGTALAPILFYTFINVMSFFGLVIWEGIWLRHEYLLMVCIIYLTTGTLLQTIYFHKGAAQVV